MTQIGISNLTILSTVSEEIATENKTRIEPATLEDLSELVDMVMELFAIEKDFPFLFSALLGGNATC